MGAMNSRADIFLELVRAGGALLENRSDAPPPVLPQRFQDTSEDVVIAAIDEFSRHCKLCNADVAAYRILHTTLCMACRLNRHRVVRHLLRAECDPRCRFLTPVE